MIIFLIFLQTISSKEIYDSQDEVLQFISRDSLDDSFSIWFKIIESEEDNYTIITIFKEEFNYINFIRVDLSIGLTVCLDEDECQQVYGIQKYQNAYIWFHIIVSKIIQIEEPLQKILFYDILLVNVDLVIINSPYFRCLVYKNLSGIKKQIKSFYYEKLVRPLEYIYLFSQQSAIQIFLKRNKEKQCKKEAYLLRIAFTNQVDISFNDKDCNQFLWNNNSILNYTEFQVSQWFEVQLIINYENIKFLLILNDFTYTDEYIVQNFQIVPLYFYLVLNLNSVNYIYQSSNYYQFYNYNEINLCHLYCQDCQNNTCLSCYVKDCECQPNQYFNIIDKSCQYYSQLYSVKVSENEKYCQRGFYLTNEGCKQFCLLYEGKISKDCFFDQVKTEIYFQFQEDLLFRQIYLDQKQQNRIYSQFFDPLEKSDKNVYEKLDDLQILLIKNKNLFLLSNYQNGFIICRYNYFGNNCQFKPFKCLYSSNQNCQICQPHYFLLRELKCKKCPKNCMLCEYDKKKIICLFAQENYYLNELGIPKFCPQQCYTCKKDGSCLNQQEITSQINCNQSDCVKQIKLECDIQDSIVIELAQQKCQRIYQSSNVFQWIQSVILSDLPFFGQYKIPFKEQLVVNSLNSNNTQVYFNKQTNLIYIFEQLKQIYYQILNNKLLENDQYYLQMKSLICTQKLIHLGQIRCLKYEQNMNIYELDKSCFINNKCKYNLTLNNVYVMADYTYCIIYENQEYFNITDLLGAIQNYGMIYGFVNINAQLIINKLNFGIQYTGKLLVIQKEKLPKFLRDSQFNIILNYETKYIYEDIFSSFLFEVDADRVIINHLFAYNEIIWKIKCFDLIINNTKILNTQFELEIQANRIFIINTLISDIRNTSNIGFRLIGNTQLLYIYNFIIVNSRFENMTIFEIENINEAFLYDVNIDKCYFYNSKLFHFYLQIQTLKIDSLIIQQVLFYKTSFTAMNNIMNLLITYTEIKESKIYEIAPLFQIYQLNYGSITQFYVLQSKSEFEFFSILNCKKVTFNNVQLQMTSNPFIKFSGVELYLNNFKIQQLDHDQLRLFEIYTTYTQLENLQYNSYVISNQINFKQYPYLIFIHTDYGVINNLQIDNLYMIDTGLLQLENQKSKFLIKNIVITNCSLQMNTSKLTNFINIINFGRLIVQNILISDLSIKNHKMDEQFQLIQIAGKEDSLTLSHLQIENVITNNKVNFLFSLQNEFVSIKRFYILNIIQMNLFCINSQNTLIQQGEIIQLQSSDIFLLTRNERYFNLFIQIQIISVDLLNGTFVKNNKIDQNYFIIIQNIQIILASLQQQIDINLKNTDLYLIDIKMQAGDVIEADQQFININNNLLTIQKVQLYVKDLIILNISCNLGEFQQLKSTHISGLFIYNINQIDKNDKQQQILQKIKPYISFTQNSSLVLRNIFIFNSSFHFNDIIQLFIYDGSISLSKLYFYNNKQINSVFNFLYYQQNINNCFLIDQLFVSNINAQNLLCTNSENQMILIKINNLFLNFNVIKQIFENQQKISFLISNSLMLNIDQLFIWKEDFKLTINDSEIINPNQLEFYQAIIKNSLIFDEITQQSKVQDKFSIDLSFNNGQSILRKKQIDQKTYQINLNNNQEQFFYLPSGQPITIYERLDLKNIQYKQIYSGFSLVIKGLQKEQIQCEIKSKLNGNQVDVFNQRYLILNQSINILDNLTAFINPFNKDYVTNDIICDSYILRFNVKGFKCQLGEYLYNNTCLQCETQKGLYSTQYNSTHCQNANYNQISQLKIGLVKLRQNYWRYSYNSIIIEQCQNEHCQGGWKPGDSSCNSSRIGALCQECDIYNKQGNGYYTKNLDNCQICEVSYRLVYQFILSILWQLFLTFMSIYSKDSLSKQLLFFKVGKRNFYKVLYKLSLDQPAVILKMLTNYLFYIYLIRENFNSISQFLILNLNLVNNPSLIMEAQLDCIFRQFQNIEIIYVKFLFSLCNLLFITNIHFMVYLLYVKFGNKFQLKLLLLIIVEIFIFNLQIILEICFKLLSFQELSQIKWIQSNLSYQYYSATHISMIYQLIIPITIILLLLPITILCLFIYNFTIMKAKIFSLFEQKYKTGQQYWGFITIYTKFIMMAISIINKKQIILQSFFCLILFFFQWRQQPYYLKNLNQIDLTLLLLYDAVTHCLMLTDNGIIFLLILFINILPIISIANYLQQKIIQLNREQIVDMKQVINNKFPKFEKYSGIEKDIRVTNNQNIFRKVVRSNFLISSKFQSNSLKTISSIKNKTQEIELGTLSTGI